MEYLFDNVSGKGIVGGDLNMSKHGIKNALRTWSSRTSPDLALTRGLTATQIAVTRVGCNTDDATSSAHELVVVQLNLDPPPRKRPSLALHNLLPRLVA